MFKLEIDNRGAQCTTVGLWKPEEALSPLLLEQSWQVVSPV
jgi:hypothetical protein